jgi:hypothetical protein
MGRTRYRLRTLLILMAIGPPILASIWIAWPYIEWKARQAVEWVCDGVELFMNSERVIVVDELEALLPGVTLDERPSVHDDKYDRMLAVR